MSQSSTETSGDSSSIDDVFDALADRYRRHLLRRLAGQAPEPLTRESLATSLVARKHDSPNAIVTKERHREALIALYHVHLPKLEAAGLIERATPEGAVTVTDHPAFRDSGITDVLGDADGSDPETLDAVFEALTSPRRRVILDALSHQIGPIHTETLAREVVAKERDVAESAVSADAIELMLAVFDHQHLPCLTEAGLVEYDPDEETVAYLGHPALRVPWMHSVLEPDFRTSLTGEEAPGEMGSIQGRERVVSYGQSLCERADEELFCLFTDTGLLEAGCLTRIRDASRERGVDVYLGTCDPVVREYVRDHAPGVTVWEPETNCLNLPVVDNRVGRLLLADREAAMLGTLGNGHDDGRDEGGDEGRRREQAIVGDGADNPLVVTVSQLLDPYFDRIDESAGDVGPRLPL